MDVLLQSTDALTPMAQLLLAVALAGKEPGQTALAVDATAQCLLRARVTPQTMGNVLAVKAGSFTSAPIGTNKLGVATTAAGTTEWVVDANKNVYVYNSSGTLLGSWSAGGCRSSPIRCRSPRSIRTTTEQSW